MTDPFPVGNRTPGALSPSLYESDASVEAVMLPIWRETLAPFEWLALHFDPVYYGYGLPRGNGEPVVLVPGFLATDDYMATLYWWLTRMGYSPYYSGIGHNIDCPDYLSSILRSTVRRIHEETGRDVHLIGHSLGGMIARSVALDYPEHIASVICLGSPFRDQVRQHPATLTLADSLRRSAGPDSNLGPTCYTGHCLCSFVKNTIQPGGFEMPHYAIYSRNDSVVDWHSCIEEDPDRNVEVEATHIGLAFDAKTYRAIARLLRRASTVPA